MKVTNNCNTCKIFHKSPPRPVVHLPMRPRFLKQVDMDWKFYSKHILLHIINHATRSSATTVTPSWISVNGLPEKFLRDNGGEFGNDNFTNMCETTYINSKLTGAESLWSNGLVERHNFILGHMLDCILEETRDNIELLLDGPLMQNIHKPTSTAFQCSSQQ